MFVFKSILPFVDSFRYWKQKVFDLTISGSNDDLNCDFAFDLKTLHISKCTLWNLDLNNFLALTFLSLESCNLQFLDLKQLNQLQILNLAGNRFQKLSDIRVSSQTRICQLNLSGNLLEEMEFCDLLRNLEHLTISDNKIRFLGFVKNMKSLKTLCVDGNPIYSLMPLKACKLQFIRLHKGYNPQELFVFDSVARKKMWF